MKTNDYGVMYFEEEDILEELYKNPNVDISNFVLSPDDSDIADCFNKAVQSHYDEYGFLKVLDDVEYATLQEFDNANQSNWYMPDEYRELDIAEWVFMQCKTNPELQRVGEELLIYQNRDMIDVLRYLKYFVDTMRKHDIVWGLGRGSSVASYVLFIIGVHKIDSLYYDLPVNEFLR